MNRLLHFLTIVLFTGLLLLSGCIPDEDPLLNPDVRDKYLGTWTVQESGKKKVTYEVQITADPGNSSQVLIYNFYNYGIKPFAVVTSATITVPTQSFSRFLEVRGSGSYSDGRINWTYYVNNGADLDTIVSVYSKQ